MADAFTGFPREGIDFWKQLEKNNNREWFQAHKDLYERACRGPMQALMDALEPKYGPSKISRINRDMRFSRDGAPYKTHIGAGIGGAWVGLSQQGVWVGAGMYKPEPAALARFRAAVDDKASGSALAAVVKSLKRKGYQVDTHETLSSAPRGYPLDHPRIDLLRMKDIFAGKLFAPSASLSSRKALERITTVIEETQPLVKWLRAHVGSRSD